MRWIILLFKAGGGLHCFRIFSAFPLIISRRGGRASALLFTHSKNLMLKQSDCGFLKGASRFGNPSFFFFLLVCPSSQSIIPAVSKPSPRALLY